jgi:hypothetical protein
MVSVVPNEPLIEEIVPVVCFNAWGCWGVEGWLLEHGAPILIAIVGALVVTRWRDLLLVAFVASAAATSASAALMYLSDPTARWGISTLTVFGSKFATGCFVFLILSGLIHLVKRWIASFLVRASGFGYPTV